MKKKPRVRGAGERGQTSIEYILLLLLTFMTGYLLITGPIATFTNLTIVTIRAALGNVILAGELTPASGQLIQPNDPLNPANPARLQPVH